MSLTEKQRQDLYQWAAWRDLQIAYYHLSSYLHFTKLEDLDVARATVMLDELGASRADFLDRWHATQGGNHGGRMRDEDGGDRADCADGNASAPGAPEAGGASGPDATRGGLYAV